MIISVGRIDHFVITKSDADATLCFYERVLGIEPMTFGTSRKALHFGNQKINIHQAENKAKPTAPNAQPGTAQEHLTTEKAAIIYGAVEQNGVLGTMDFVYFRDPDGIFIEIGVYR